MQHQIVKWNEMKWNEMKWQFSMNKLSIILHVGWTGGSKVEKKPSKQNKTNKRNVTTG